MHVPLWDPRDKPGVVIRYAHSMKDPDVAFYHYVRITADKDNVHTEVIKIDQNIKYEGISKYLSIAGLYVKTLGRIYFKYVLIGLFLLVPIVDGLLEYLYQQKQKSTQNG